MTPNAHNGSVVLLGAGPGDPQLLTLQGARELSRADTVVYDRLAAPALLDLAPPAAERIYVGKGRAGNEMNQDQINALLIDRARAGKRVVRLKGGDPFIFGRGGEEALALAHAGIPFRVVPGITAAAGAAAYAGIPLTDRRFASSLALITGQEDPNRPDSRLNYAALAGIDTLVFYMGVKNLPEIAVQLIAAGRSADTPAAIIERGTTPRQRTITGTLATLPALADQHRVQPPALIIVGQVVTLHDDLAWRKSLPLSGRTVLVTRTRDHASDLARQLLDLGAEVIEAPTIAIEPPLDWTPIDSALRQLAQYHLVCFTSVNGVNAFVSRLMHLKLDARILANLRIAAVGSATAAALRDRFLIPDIIPDVYTTDALADALATLPDLAGRNVLLARADIARPALADALRQAGAIVTDLPIYRTVCPDQLPPAALDALRDQRVDWITFTSSSTVTNFFRLIAPLAPDHPESILRRDGRNVWLASIGPVASQTLRQHGLAPTVEALTHDMPGLVNAIRNAEQVYADEVNPT